MSKGTVKTSLSKPTAVSVPAAAVHKVREPLLKRPLDIIFLLSCSCYPCQFLSPLP